MRTHPLTLLATAAALSLVLAACGQEDPLLEQPPIDDVGGDDPAEEPDPDGDDLPSDAPTEDAASSDSREITLATADAAERTGVAEDEVTFVSFEMVTWPDGSLGCPEPDTMYTQALVEGYRIVLEADGTPLTYHGALGDDPFYCAEPDEPVDAGA
jgi:predicted small lipoprotein YifL